MLDDEPDIHVVAEAADGADLLSATAQVRPHVVLLDVEMPGHVPSYAIPRLLRVRPQPKLIVVSMHDDPRLVQEMIKLGVRGYLHKAVARHDLLMAIRSVHRSRHGVTVLLSKALSWNMPPDSPTGVLTEREQEVLSLVALALSNRQIAAQLSITEGTVKRHLRNVFGKLGAVSRIDAVNKASKLPIALSGSTPLLPSPGETLSEPPPIQPASGETPSDAAPPSRATAWTQSHDRRSHASAPPPRARPAPDAYDFLRHADCAGRGLPRRPDRR
ncbi:DNA-binding NarL/FixJ family response regulator [Nonomuraea jabiensis]|uniref:DNA-binding NarL/FixJ family response regulator n=2 Tax=Nonomuraea jabiensis TaxID=882448 RepID=A0A7W9GDI5_9ACTN|nr:DNA-binding NarL/FixJ family response regulator [Nonomuraea jabiensis]